MGTEQALGWEKSSEKLKKQPRDCLEITGSPKEQSDGESGVWK